jgi:hypothetical protein
LNFSGLLTAWCSRCPAAAEVRQPGGGFFVVFSSSADAAD